MGQYHKFMNFDKKQVLVPSSLRKLTEWSYQLNDDLLQVEKLLKTSWKGDNVLVIGDYVDEFYANSKHTDLLKNIRKINNDYNIENIYYYPYEKISISNYDSIPTRYIYNHAKEIYLDLKRQPIQWIDYDEEKHCIYGAKFHPLSLLLSCSNGAGGGDYYSINKEYIGEWAFDSKNLELSDNLLDLPYHELDISFDERQYKDKSNDEMLIDFISSNIKEEELSKIKFSKALFLSKEEKENILNKSLDILKENQKVQKLEEQEIEK